MSTVTLNVEITLKFSRKEWIEDYTGGDELGEPFNKQMIIDELNDDYVKESMTDEMMGEMDGMTFEFQKYEVTKVKVKSVKGARV